MRATALLVALLALTASAQSTPRFKRFTQRTDQGRNSRGLLANQYAFFEAFPSSGAGLTTACSTTAPTGARGEALTFTRTGSATCTRTATGGLATTGIADGDLVSLSGNVARVEYDSAGVLGLLVESSRTNSTLRSEELDNASWTEQHNTAAATTVSNVAATSPAGTATAERVQVQATNAAQYSFIYQVAGCPASTTASGSFYVKGNAGSSGTVDVVVYSGAGFFTAPCAYNGTTWTRCAKENVATIAGTTQFGIGNASSLNGGIARSAADILVWGAQCEAGAYATSYIPTTTASAVRNVESPSFTVASTGPTACLAASVTWPSSAVGAVNVAALGDAVNNLTLYRTSNTAAGFQINGTTTAPAVSAIDTTTHRALLYDNAGTRAAFWDGSSVAAPAATMASSQTLVWVGRNVSGTPADGIVSRIQVDPNALRCSAL